MMGMMGLSAVFVVAIVGAIAYALGWRPQFNQTGPAQTSQTPLEILNARYARGEITREEYDRMCQDLDSILAVPAYQQTPGPLDV